MDFFVIILLIFLCIIAIFYLMMRYINNKRSDIFLTTAQLYHYLINDIDNFYNKLKPIDLLVRNVDNVKEYKENIYDSLDEFTNDEMIKLTNAMKECDYYLKSIIKPGFDGIKCEIIPWKIGCIVGNKYEYGLPHTRGEIILFPRNKLSQDPKIFTRTLIHERIHIYQKKYPEDVEKFLKDNGYKKYKPINLSKTRANPDIDNWTYTDNEGNIMSAEYKKNANTIRDVVFSPKNSYEYEHPLEKMAIDIARNY